MDGGAICGVEFCDGGADGVLFVANGAGMADAADLPLPSGDFGGGICVVVGLPGVLCGLYGAREFGEPDARGGIADDVCDDGVDRIISDIEEGSEHGHTDTRSDVSGAGNGERARVLHKGDMVHAGDFDLGIKLYLGVFAANGGCAKAG